MFTKIVIISVMLLILTSLGSGLFFLIQDTGQTQRTLKALTVRITLSVALFCFLLISFHFGWLKP